MEQEVAIVTMYQYYMANKQTLPSNISSQREFILNQLSQGKDVSAVFQVAVEKAIEILPPSWKKIKRAQKPTIKKS
jgi:hypothetical protein